MLTARILLAAHGPAIRAAAGQTRALLELFWPMWRESSSIPAPEPGVAISDLCCIHSAIVLRDLLARRVPGVSWAVAGGLPTRGQARGGYARLGAQKGVQHCWVHGADPGLPGMPLVLVDVTGDQFGEAPVLVASLPQVKYLENASPRLLQEFEQHEAEVVALFSGMAEASDRLFPQPG